MLWLAMPACARTTLILLSLHLAQALVTQGPWIVNSTTNQRVYLKCANWYGAHTELFVVGGLMNKSVASLADSFKNTGANCARIPYSVEMALLNPVVDPTSISGILPSDNCKSVLRALDVMDCVIAHLKSRGIMIFFNNHNSNGTWVGAQALKRNQGLWNLPGYSTEDWVNSMEVMVRRYKMAGMDLRNEIHDQGGVKITWGESEDVDTDWLAASSLAYDRLHAIDPEILARVGGLCWNIDLRKMAKRVGPIKAFDNRKLVYTAHIYSFTFWWRAGGFSVRFLYSVSLVTGLFLLIISSASFYTLHRDAAKYNFTACSAALPMFASSLIYFALWLCMALVFSRTASEAGCSSMAEDAQWLIIASSLFVGLTGLSLVCSLFLKSPWLLLLASCTMWLGLWLVGLAVICAYLDSEKGHRDYLKLWALNDRPVPVWVGEFGTGMPGEPVFQFLWRYIFLDYELDFAYWSFNGMKYKDNQWVSEPFGLLDDDWNEWRHPLFVFQMFNWYYYGQDIQIGSFS